MAESKQTPVGLSEIVRDAGLLANKRSDLQSLRQEHTREWALNREFYKGNQWSWWSQSTGRVETLPSDDGDKPRYTVRLTLDEIKPGVSHYVAQLTKNRPVIEASADSGADKDIKAAQLATALYEWWWKEFSLSEKLNSALVHAALSQGYWKISWDPLAGKSMKLTVDPEGKPITDEEVADAFKSQLEAQGVDPTQFEQTVYMGDLRVEVMPGENVFLDPTPKQFADATYAFCDHYMEPDEIKMRWPKAKSLNISPDASPTDGDATFAFLNDERERPKTTKRVTIGYFRPSPAIPKGRYVVFLENPNVILAESDWPYPFNELPLVKFPGIEHPDSPYDLPVTSMARPLQKELNKSESQVVMHKNLTLKPQMLAPVGSLQQRLTTEPGAVFEFNPIGNAVPQWREMPNLPSYVFEHIADLRAQLSRVFNRLPSQRDELPARLDSGGSIDLIHEAVADQLSPVILRLEGALARAGMMMLKLAQVYYIEQRTMKIGGPGSAVRSKKFKNTDLNGGFGLHAQSMSGLPRTRAGKQERIKFLLENGLIDPRQAMKHLDVADMNGVLARLAADEDHALREHDRILAGAPVNMAAYQEALAAVQEGVNPQSGQPLQSEEEVQQVLLMASLMPGAIDNDPVHADTHSNYMKSVEFEALSPDVQSRFAIHLQLTQQKMAANQPQQPAEKPRVSLALKGTTSAPVAGEILRATGIEVSDEEVALPPLETWVTDSMDKPDMDEAGNDILTQQEQMMAMRQSEEKHALTLAKASHEVALAEKKATEPDHSGVEQERAEELHQQSLRHREAAHEEKIRASREKKESSGGGEG